MPRQASFAGGEIAPELYGRTDVARYPTSLRTCLNFIATPLGPLKNRPGTVFTRETKTGATAVRLVPFVFSNDQTYVLEFGALYIRVFSAGGVVLSGGVPVDIVTTYAAADLFRLTFTQSGDVLTICHPSYPPRNLTRSSHTSWAIASLGITHTVQPPTTLTVSASLAAGTGQVAKNWSIVITAVAADGEESEASNELALIAYVIYQDKPVTYTFVAPASGVTPVYYRVYRGRNGVFGFIGSTDSVTFNDDGQEPDYRDPPFVGDNPFYTTDRYPSTACYFQGRRYFGGTNLQPQTVWATPVGRFSLLDIKSPKIETDSLEFTIASRQYEQIRALVPGVTLLLMTASSEWTAASGDAPVSPTSLQDARPRSQWGSAWLPPIIIGDLVLFVPTGAASVRDLENDAAVGSLRGSDLTLLAPHLFGGYTIVDWAFQKLPFPVVWVVRSDGVLLGLTYEKEQQVWAWHRHTTTGTFESVACVPESNASALYAVVKRTVNGVSKRYVERFASRLVTDANLRTCVFTDSAIAFNGRNLTAQTVTFFAAAGWTAGSAAVIERSAGTFVAGDIGDYIVIGPDGQNCRSVVTSVISATRVNVEHLADVPLNLQSNVYQDWAWARHTFTGATHLAALEVYGLGDGDVVGPYTVTAGGALTIDEPVVDLTVGLRYLADAELLDVADPKNEQKRVTRAFIEVVGSRGLQAGESFTSNLDQWTQREVADGFAYLSEDATVVEVLIEGTWNRGGRVVIRQSDPLPLTVLAVSRELEAGGK